MIRLRSITLRLALLFGSASTLVLILVGAITGALVEMHFEKLDLHELAGKLELTGHLLAKARSPDDLDLVALQLDEALIGHHGLSVTIVRADGSVFYATPGPPLPTPLLDAPAGKDKPLVWQQDGRAYRGIAARMDAGHAALPAPLVAVALDIGHHQAFMASFKTTLWSAVLLGILLTLLLGWLAARRGLAPVRNMADAARGISASSLHDRLPVDQAPRELRELAQSFNAMLARLEDSFQRLSNFSSDLAHELRTPVSNLMTETQVAVSKSRPAEEYREILYSNLEEYDRLARMISDMLFIAKADNGLIVPRREDIDLASEIDGLIEYYQPLAEEKSIAVHRHGRAALSGDRLMIRRAIANLLSNALRHTPEGGRIEVRAETGLGEGEGAQIAVENSGSEIPAEHLPHLFDRFYQVDPSRHRHSDGAGLGLAIVKSIAETHRGTISVTSAHGRTAFVLRIPRD